MILIIWIVLFLWRKDLRREIICLSIIFGVLGILTEIVHVKDWWKPLTITNTIPSIEDFLFGFCIGGIASVIYEAVFKKRVKIRKSNQIKTKKRNLRLISIIILGILVFFGSFYLLKLNSFYSAMLSSLIPTLVIYIKRKDLILDSIFSGFLLLFIPVITYSIAELIFPGWVQAFWYFKNVQNIVILNVPIDDLIWYFFAGLVIGPLYEYWQEGRIIKKK